MESVLSAIIALVVSVVCNKILAVHTFNVIDGYVKELIEMAENSIRDAYLKK